MLNAVYSHFLSLSLSLYIYIYIYIYIVYFFHFWFFPFTYFFLFFDLFPFQPFSVCLSLSPVYFLRSSFLLFILFFYSVIYLSINLSIPIYFLCCLSFPISSIPWFFSLLTPALSFLFLSLSLSIYLYFQYISYVIFLSPSLLSLDLSPFQPLSSSLSPPPSLSLSIYLCYIYIFLTLSFFHYLIYSLICLPFYFSSPSF